MPPRKAKAKTPAPAVTGSPGQGEPREPAAEAYPYTDPDEKHIGLGATGNLDVPECPLCLAHGGGGHGSNCPNADRDPDSWITTLPDGWTGPERETT